MKNKIIISIVAILAIVISMMYLKTNDKTGALEVDKLDIIDSALLKKDSEYKFVFFGYAGCYHFCDPRLRQVDPIYKEMKKSLDIKMLFIDISEDQNHTASELFVKDVNGEFEAINPDTNGIKVLQKKFQDVYVRKLPDGEYLHSGFLYLLKKYKQNYYILKIYPEFVNSDAVIADIKKLSSR